VKSQEREPWSRMCKHDRGGTPMSTASARLCTSRRELGQRPAPNACRDQGVEAEEEAIPKIATAMKTMLPRPTGADRRRAKRANHDRVDDAHRHPPDLSHDDGTGETEELSQAVSMGNGGHGTREGRWVDHTGWPVPGDRMTRMARQ